MISCNAYWHMTIPLSLPLIFALSILRNLSGSSVDLPAGCWWWVSAVLQVRWHWFLSLGCGPWLLYDTVLYQSICFSVFTWQCAVSQNGLTYFVVWGKLILLYRSGILGHGRLYPRRLDTLRPSNLSRYGIDQSACSLDMQCIVS